MVDSSKCIISFAPECYLGTGKDVKINANKFVTQNAGKLRDYYRIGKMLGSGKLNL
jgi:hypothetical protein